MNCHYCGQSHWESIDYEECLKKTIDRLKSEISEERKEIASLRGKLERSDTWGNMAKVAKGHGSKE